jgi:hypothetical protein
VSWHATSWEPPVKNGGEKQIRWNKFVPVAKGVAVPICPPTPKTLFGVKQFGHPHDIVICFAFFLTKIQKKNKI